MVSAATQLIQHIQNETTSNSQLAANTYLFNVAGFDSPSGSNTSPVTLYNPNNPSNPTNPYNTNFAGATTAINAMSPGLDTHMSDALTQVISFLGTNGNGTSSSAPLKFLIIVTDGLQSDRNANWNCPISPDPAWNNYSTCFGGYATGISQSQCTTLKNNGIVVAVLETPYVPLDGEGSPVNSAVFPQDPPVHPYETTVRHVIYPGGPTSASAISAGLQNCASSGYYYQATSSSNIASGFTSLADKFIYSNSYVKH